MELLKATSIRAELHGTEVALVFAHDSAEQALARFHYLKECLETGIEFRITLQTDPKV